MTIKNEIQDILFEKADRWNLNHQELNWLEMLVDNYYQDSSIRDIIQITYEELHNYICDISSKCVGC